MIGPLINFAISAVYTAILFPIALLMMLFTWDSGAGMWLAREAWGPLQIFLARATLDITGQENVDPKRPTIYVSNHQSTIDIIVLLRAIPINFRFVAKASLRWVPFLGWYLWLAGHILIDRGNSQKAIASLEKAARRIRNGISI